MSDSRPEPQHGGMLRVVLGLLRADAPEQITAAPQSWPRWAALLPHVLAATSHFDSLPGHLQDACGADASWLLGRAAIYLQVHARFAEARRLAERALAIDENVYGPDHPKVAAALNNLGLILKNLGQLAEARPLAERSLAIIEAAYGPDHPTAAIRLNTLALILNGQGQSAEARPLAERSLAITEAAHGPDHPSVAAALNTLALILHDLGESAVARPLAERALAIAEAAYGPDHPTVVTLRTNARQLGVRPSRSTER